MAAKIIVKGLVEDESGRVLLLRRTKTAPRRPLMWDYPGGMVDTADFESEAKREVREESGLEIDNLELVYAATNRYEEHGVVIVLFYRAKSSSPAVKLSYEHDDFMWAVPDQLPELNPYPLHQTAVRFIYNL